jgi:hypothetical protein
MVSISSALPPHTDKGALIHLINHGYILPDTQWISCNTLLGKLELAALPLSLSLDFLSPLCPYSPLSILIEVYESEFPAFQFFNAVKYVSLVLVTCSDVPTGIPSDRPIYLR